MPINKYSHITLKRFLLTVFFFSLAASQIFAQVPARRIATPPLALRTVRKATITQKPKMRPLHKKLPTKIFGNTSKHEFLTEKTSIIGNKGKISFEINLGEPIVLKSQRKIFGATDKQFSELSWSNLIIDKLPAGVTYMSSGKYGEPEIPALMVMMAIPDGASGITPFSEQPSSKSISKTYFAPRGDKDGARIYSEKNYFSAATSSLLLSPQAKMRTMNMVSLTIPLAEFNARSGDIKAKKKFTCGISFSIPSQITANSKRNADPVFEQLYSKTVANASDILAFRSGFHSHPSNQINQKNAPQFANPTFDKSVTNWIDPSAPYIKLYATRTGLYRVTPQMIAPKFNISSWHPSEIRMFNKGKEVPIWIDSAADGSINAIEYFGERLAGYPGEYYNWSSDSNAYWLTNSRKFQTSPLRFIDKLVAGNPALVISEGNITLHHEQDNFYYGGDAGGGDCTGDETKTLQRNEWMPGERFVWQYLPNVMNNNPVLQVSDSFMISSLPSNLTGKTATVIAFFRGVSNVCGTTVTHNGAIFINGNETDVSFNDFSELRDTFTFPLSQLKIGANTFQIVYRTANQPDKWYFDYYSISLSSPLSPSVDTGIAIGQWDFTITPIQQQYTLSLQSASGAPHVYNLSDGSRLITNGSSGTNITYPENGASINHYVAATTQTFLSPDRIDTVITRFASALDTLQGADYIMITHPLFFNTAQRLAARRQSFSGLRTKVITTDDVFNAFNFGSDEPWALRRYLQYAFDFYSGAPPAFVTLFGEGKWDPKFNLNNPLQEEAAKTIHRTYVPTYGIPNSDYIFTTVEGSSEVDSQTFRMVISRIPVESQDEAESYLAKVIEYETSAPAPWNKNCLFVSGGDPGGQFAELLQDNQLFVGIPPPESTNEFGGLGNPPISMQPTFIFRHDLVDQIDVSQIPAIQTAFQTGQSLVYFFGHGAPNITDIQFPDVGTLRNPGLYPVLMTVSCRTGAFAEPNFISMNESFVRVPEAGAILAYGTTGFGEVSYDFNMSAHIFNFMRGDSLDVRMPVTGSHKLNFPMIFTISKFIVSVLEPRTSSGAFVQLNSLYEYSTLGDAALGFAFRPQPEFNITPPDILLEGKDSIPRTVFSLNDSEITVKYVVHNYGYGIDHPVHIRITDNEPGGRQIVLIDSIESLELIDTSGFVISLDSFAVGSNTLDVFVDFDNKFAETDENDNEAQVTFLVNGNGGAPFYPPEGSKYFCDITPDSVHIITLLPHTTFGAKTTLDIQFDTTSTFSSPKDFTGLQGTGLFFEKSFARSTLPNPDSHVLWWRSSALLPNGKQSAFQTQSFSLDAPKPTGARSEFSYSSGDQFQNTIISGLQVDKTVGALFIPTNDTEVFDVKAQGSFNTNVVPPNTIGEVFINGKPVYITPDPNGSNFNGVILIELTPDGSTLDSVTEFNNPGNSNTAGQQALVDSFAVRVAQIPDGIRVIVLTNFQGVIPNFSTDTKVTNAMQSLGSANGMFALQYFGSYVLVGKKGLAKGTAKENFGNDGFLGAEVIDTVITLGTSGFAQTPPTAIATGYGNLKWKAQNVNSNSKIKFTVLGIRKNGGLIDTVAKIDAASGTSADLSVNPASFYDKLFVQMNFQRSSSSTVSPRLNLLELVYDAAPDFYIADSSLIATPRTVLEGSPVTATYQVQNVTCIDADNVPVQLVQTYHGNSVILATDTIKHFAGHQIAIFSHQITTTGFSGDINLTATVNPGGALNEQLAFDNSASTIYTVVRDSAKPKLDLVFDSRHINSGDYVSSNVTIEIRLSADNPIRVTDSASLKGVLQPLFGTKGPTTFTGGTKTDSFTVVFKTLPTGALQATLDITPTHPLASGRYLFTAFGNDASGNRTDSLSDEFVISGTNGLDHVMNYPNPFKDNTFFTFILKSGSQADVKVVVYTVAGRKIRTLHLDPTKQHAGLNSIEWDGRDEMGNDVANGTYLYRIVLNGTNDDGTASSDATTERAVRSR